MQVQERIISNKRHTIGFVINNVEYTRKQAIKQVRRGNVYNARVVNSPTYGKYLVGDGVSLYSLPTRFSMSRRFAGKQNV